MRTEIPLLVTLALGSATASCDRVRERLSESDRDEGEPAAQTGPPAPIPFPTPPATPEGLLDIPALTERLSPSVALSRTTSRVPARTARRTSGVCPT